MSERDAVFSVPPTVRLLPPEFRHITPERVEALYQTLISKHDAPNSATKFSVKNQAARILEDEQERVTRIYEALGWRGDEARRSHP